MKRKLFLGDPDDVLQLKGRDIPFVKNVTCLGVTCDRRLVCGHHIERTIAKALRAHVRKDLFSIQKYV